MRRLFFASAAALVLACGGASTGGGGPQATTYSVSGAVSGVVLQGVPVTLSSGGASLGTNTTDASGNYSFSGLSNGVYTVAPTLAGYTFTPPTIQVTISGSNVVGQDFTAVATSSGHTISGTISGAVAAGVRITLSEHGTVIASNTSSSSGEYHFTGLSDGNYKLTPTLNGYSFSPSSLTVVMNGADATGINFASILGYSVSGTISGAIAAGVQVSLTQNGNVVATNTSSPSGNYQFTGVADGNYTLTPTLNSYSFTPPALGILVNGADVTGQNFTSTAQNPPAAPANLSATARDGQVALNWTAVSGASTYSVYYSTTSGAETGSSGTAVHGITSTSSNIGSLSNGTPYFFVVTASNSIGESPASSEVSATPTAAPTTFTVGGTVSGLATRLIDNTCSCGMTHDCSTNNCFSAAATTPCVCNSIGDCSNCSASNSMIDRAASGLSVTLQDNGTDNLSLSSNGGFQFLTAITQGQQYAVTVASSGQPLGATPITLGYANSSSNFETGAAGSQTCTISNGGPGAVSGTVANVTVTCLSNYGGPCSYPDGALDLAECSPDYPYCHNQSRITGSRCTKACDPALNGADCPATQAISGGSAVCTTNLHVCRF